MTRRYVIEVDPRRLALGEVAGHLVSCETGRRTDFDGSTELEALLGGPTPIGEAPGQGPNPRFGSTVGAR
jgi:hypothetical protein